MKKFRVILAAALASTIALSMVGCGQKGYPTVNENLEVLNLNTTFETYDNKDFNAYVSGSDCTIDTQWEGYGIGDPFVMRYNGMYYMYVSSLNFTPGVRAYKSADLINWQICTGAGLPAGFVSRDEVATTGAYAPEVYYFNGKFYMYTAPGGVGHYVLEATSPEGPFNRVTDNLGMSIDGSVFIDDDETMIFMHADGSGIRARLMDSMTEIQSRNRVLDNTSIGGWTEGPYLLKRDGIYYLTYTGNAVTSEAYRISYSASTNDSLVQRDADGEYLRVDSFTKGIDGPLAINTEGQFRGLGHSSTVLGPDLDSYYIAYHTLNSVVGPNRSFAIDRLLFNGTQMSVAPRFEESVKPKLPAFYAQGADAEKFDTANGFVLSKDVTGANFTAELNAIGNAEYVVGYQDASNYFVVSADFAAKKITLSKVSGGSASVVAEGTFKNTFSTADNHTIRIAHRDGKVDVVFDNMTKIDDARVTIPAGKVGYKTTTATIGYSAFSNVAMGMSDEIEVKQSTARIGASLYARTKDYSDGYKFTGKTGIKTVSEGDLAGTKVLDFANAYDYASYYVNFDKDATYGLEMIYEAKDGGKKLGIRLDQGNVMVVQLPKIKTDSSYVKALVTEFDVTRGAHAIRLEGVSAGTTFASFRFVETSKDLPAFTADLSNFAPYGTDYKTIWRIEKGGHYAQAGTRQLVYFGDETLTDFTLSVEMMFDGDPNTSTAGILLRGKNYAAASSDTYESIQGYYVKFNDNLCALDRLNFSSDSKRNLAIVPRTQNPFYENNGNFVTIKVTLKGSKITVWANGEELFSFEDDWAISAGHIGLYTDGAAVVYRNLSVTPA